MRASERQRGQALPMLLLLMAALLAGFLLVFDAGQLASAKLRLQGAADAAAYSAAQWQARALNDQAYLNRAMVANEVAIAQSVSLRSWSRYIDRLLQNASLVGSLVPPVGAVLRQVQQAWANVDRGLQRALPQVESATSRWNVDVLAGAQEVAARVMGPASADLALRVARANVPEAAAGQGGQALLLRDVQRAQSFTAAHARRGDGRARLREVVLASRDGFSASRGWSVGFAGFGLRKRGGTDLIGYDDWRGMDTLAHRVPVLFGSSEHPVAWGAAENQRLSQSARGFHGGAWRDTPRTARQADGAMVTSRSYQGLPGYRDVAALRASQPPVLRFELALAQPGAGLATSERVLDARTVVPGEAERPNAAAWAGGQLHALAAAEVSFRRPEGRRDGQRELPSLFNPYWQARLVPTSRAQRALALAAEGLADDPYLATELAR